jgi:hypothetical protein
MGNSASKAGQASRSRIDQFFQDEGLLPSKARGSVDAAFTSIVTRGSTDESVSPSSFSSIQTPAQRSEDSAKKLSRFLSIKKTLSTSRPRLSTSGSVASIGSISCCDGDVSPATPKTALYRSNLHPVSESTATAIGNHQELLIPQQEFYAPPACVINIPRRPIGMSSVPVRHSQSELARDRPYANVSQSSDVVLPSPLSFNSSTPLYWTRSPSQEGLDRILAEELQREEYRSVLLSDSSSVLIETNPFRHGDSVAPVSNPWSPHRDLFTTAINKKQNDSSDSIQLAVRNHDTDSEEQDKQLAIQLQTACNISQFTGAQQSQKQLASDLVLALQIQYDLDGQEPDAVTRDCIVCGEETPIPNLPVLLNCTHIPQTCADCFATWIASELESKGWKYITCPESGCKERLQHTEVQQYAAPEVYEKYIKTFTSITLAHSLG